MGEILSRHEEMTNAYTVLVRKPEGKRPFGLPWNGEENTTMDVKERECEFVEWI
jgi:hypothetical protein